ncbi:MAG: ArnT family glycosyltransferase [Chloroflexota bacterium]
MKDSPRSFFGRLHTLTLVLLFLAALAIRLYDLTDLPLDFHPTRQLFSALKARGMYYLSLTGLPHWMRAEANQQMNLRVTVEPEIIERLVAFTWRFTGDELWVARVYSIAFWLIGGIFLYLLARDLFSPDGALFAAAFYLFLPYGIYASRSFQPDPLMVTLILGFWWAIVRWAEEISPRRREGREDALALREVDSPSRSSRLRGSNWLWVILASLFGGLAIFIKLSAAFFVIGGALGAALGRFNLREIFRNPQVYAMAILGALPGAAWVIYGISSGFLGQQFGGRFIPSLLVSPSYYLGWLQMIGNVLGPLTIALALLGLFFVREKKTRALSFGLWGAYFAFGFFFNYHISTHDYYSLPLIPIAALSLTPLAELGLAHLTESTSGSRVKRTLAASVLTLGLFAVVWNARGVLKSVDYRPEADMWAEIGETLGHPAPVAALTQDYGARLAYWGWETAVNWPRSSDFEYSELRGGGSDYEKRLGQLAGKFFLVTDFDDLKRQPQLEEYLLQFPVFAEGEGYIIYDLRKGLP